MLKEKESPRIFDFSLMIYFMYVQHPQSLLDQYNAKNRDYPFSILIIPSAQSQLLLNELLILLVNLNKRLKTDSSKKNFPAEEIIIQIFSIFNSHRDAMDKLQVLILVVFLLLEHNVMFMCFLHRRYI